MFCATVKKEAHVLMMVNAFLTFFARTILVDLIRFAVSVDAFVLRDGSTKMAHMKHSASKIGATVSGALIMHFAIPLMGNVIVEILFGSLALLVSV